MAIYLSYWQLTLIIAIAFIFLLGLFLFVKKKLKRSGLQVLDKKEIKNRWLAIEALLGRKDETSYKLAVLEADKLFDYVLRDMGFGGSSLGERLKVVCYKYPNLRKVWAAHKVRNNLAHETDYHLRESEARRAIGGFKEGLKELGVL